MRRVQFLTIESDYNHGFDQQLGEFREALRDPARRGAVSVGDGGVRGRRSISSCPPTSDIVACPLGCQRAHGCHPTWLNAAAARVANESLDAPTCLAS